MSELRQDLNSRWRQAQGAQERGAAPKRPEREEEKRRPSRSRGTAIIREETAQEIARHTIRWTALGALALSFAGAALAFNGSALSPWWSVWQLSPLAVGAGVVLQVFCTLMEWAHRSQRRSPKYLGPLLLDIGSTYLGFAPLLVPVVQGALGRAGVAGLLVTLLAHAAVAVGAWWLAHYPETHLVK